MNVLNLKKAIVPLVNLAIWDYETGCTNVKILNQIIWFWWPVTRHRALVTWLHPSWNPCRFLFLCNLGFQRQTPVYTKTHLFITSLCREVWWSAAPPLPLRERPTAVCTLAERKVTVWTKTFISGGESTGNSSSLSSFHKMEIYSTRALVWKQFRARGAVKQWGSQGLIGQLMAVSPVRETLTAPWGAINRVALDNNSCQALPPRSPALPSQAKQEDERKGCEGDRKWCRGILRRAQSRPGGH